MKHSIHYRIFPKNPEAHLFEVTCTVEDPDPEGQRFALPAWIPGSYMIREFARHVVAISAKAGRRPLAIAKLDKSTREVYTTPLYTKLPPAMVEHWPFVILGIYVLDVLVLMLIVRPRGLMGTRDA